MAEQDEVVVSAGWWTARDGRAVLVCRSETPQTHNGVLMPWCYGGSLRYWSDAGECLPGQETEKDLIRKIAATSREVR